MTIHLLLQGPAHRGHKAAITRGPDTSQKARRQTSSTGSKIPQRPRSYGVGLEVCDKAGTVRPELPCPRSDAHHQSRRELQTPNEGVKLRGKFQFVFLCSSGGHYATVSAEMLHQHYVA